MVEFQLPKLTTRVRFPSLALNCYSSVIVRTAVLLGLGFAVAGCASVESLPSSTSVSPVPRSSSQGVYHKVQKGETLWRISKAYDVGIDDITRGNKIPDVAHLEENQLIFIPGATKAVTVPPSETSVFSSPGDTSKPVVARPGDDEFDWPVRGRILRYFGDRHGSYFNQGISIEVPEGRSIVAARPGRVVFADYLTGYDYTVILDHCDGYLSVYSVNSKILVRVGDMVAKGDRVAVAGRKGNSSFLYFEIRHRSSPENPLHYLPRT